MPPVYSSVGKAQQPPSLCAPAPLHPPPQCSSHLAPSVPPVYSSVGKAQQPPCLCSQRLSALLPNVHHTF
eukprot:3940788-Rhodomonas_salina.4